jgi:hypothetical protein
MPFAFLSRRKAPDVSRCRLRQSPGVLATTQGSEVVLFDTRAERYYTLNDVGAAAWALLREPRTLDEMVNVIGGEYAVPRGVVTADLHRLLEDLQAAGLLVAESAS